MMLGLISNGSTTVLVSGGIWWVREDNDNGDEMNLCIYINGFGDVLIKIFISKDIFLYKIFFKWPTISRNIFLC